MNLTRRIPELLLPVGILACLLVIFIPLPPAVMDILLSLNIGIAVVLLLTALYVRRPLEFSVFPALLLATTLARLALNIATTRLILTRGASDGANAAGEVIRNFAVFVSGDHLIVGLILFAIIVTIQFVVITKGASRISEVAARFTLDALPGRQMSIDAALAAGEISSEESARMRAELVDLADFYGSMDGASKFVRGDAIAGIIITLVNVLGGLAVGISEGMTLGQSADVFTRLTIGDGLVSQLPALLISIAAGLLVARRSRETNLPMESFRQLVSHPIVLTMTAVFLGLSALTDLPTLPLLALAAGFGVLAWSFRNAAKPVATPPKETAPTPPEIPLHRLLNHEVMELELGMGLLQLADPNRGGTLMDSVRRLRLNLADDLGIILPRIRIHDNLRLAHDHYQIMIQGNPIEIGTIHPELLFAVDEGNASGPITGAVAADSHHGRLAFWIHDESSEAARNAGYLVMTAAQALTERLKTVVRLYADDLLTRDAVRQLIDEFKTNSPAIVDELIPARMSLASLQRVLKMLVREGVSIRPLGLILETIADHVEEAPSLLYLVDLIRQKLSPQITSQLLGPDDRVAVMVFSETLERQLEEGWKTDGNEVTLTMPKDRIAAFAHAMHEAAESLQKLGAQPTIWLSPEARWPASAIARAHKLDIRCVSRSEIPADLVEVMGEITQEKLAAKLSAA